MPPVPQLPVSQPACLPACLQVQSLWVASLLPLQPPPCLPKLEAPNFSSFPLRAAWTPRGTRSTAGVHVWEHQPSHAAHTSLPACPLLPFLALSLIGKARDKTKMKSPNWFGEGWIPGAVLTCATSQLRGFKSNPWVEQPWKEWFSPVAAKYPFKPTSLPASTSPCSRGVAYPWGKIILDFVAADCVTVVLVYSWLWQSFWSRIPCPGVDQTRGSGPAWH